MPDQIIRDKRGARIGSVRSDSRGNMTFFDSVNKRLGTVTMEANGYMTARDASGRKIGTYEARANVTRDARGIKTASGNALPDMFFATTERTASSAP